jgi:hypothetical protein
LSQKTKNKVRKKQELNKNAQSSTPYSSKWWKQLRFWSLIHFCTAMIKNEHLSVLMKSRIPYF